MSTTYSPPPTPPSLSAPRRRTVLAVAGTALAALGGIAPAAATPVIVASGVDGTLNSGAHKIGRPHA